MNLNIDQNHYAIVLDILKKNLHDLHSSVYVFGSRAKGNTKKFADLDLAIDCNKKKLPIKTTFNLSINFEDSILPYKVDIVDLNSISKEFKTVIEKDLVKII